jgi:AraC family transcriptional activator of pobA
MFQPAAFAQELRQQRRLLQALNAPMAQPLLTTTTAPATTATTDEITVLSMDEVRCGMGAFYRRDQFKAILVVAGDIEMHYATRSFAISKPALVFTNRLVPYSWEPVEGGRQQEGYLCIFTEAFLHSAMRGVSLKESVLYKVNGNPVYFLDDEQLPYFAQTFARMHREAHSDYAHKYDLLRDQLSITIHEAARLQPASAHPAIATNAAERITNLFLQMLDAQFPVIKQLHEPILKNAQEYADRLAVHVNHLNRSVKDVTGKSTTVHLAERFVSEAKVLLQHTDWSVGNIADRLGFEYATYFNSFFKKHTGATPLAFRKVVS